MHTFWILIIAFQGFLIAVLRHTDYRYMAKASRCWRVNEVTEKHPGNILCDNIYKYDMKSLIGDFYMRTNSVISNNILCDSVTLNNFIPHIVQAYTV